MWNTTNDKTLYKFDCYFMSSYYISLKKNINNMVLNFIAILI